MAARAALLAVLLALSCAAVAEAAVGVNWGTLSSHRAPPQVVVDLLRENRIGKVKLFDADPWTVSALAGSGLQAMLAVPNDHLHSVARDPRRARDWVRDNVTRNIQDGVDVR
jgi:hypothetical protein